MGELRVHCLARQDHGPDPAQCLAALPPGCDPVLLDSTGGVGFSVLAWAPDCRIAGALEPNEDGGEEEISSFDPAQLLQHASEDEHWIFDAGLPHAGVGWIGWFGFECAHAYERYAWSPRYPDQWPDFSFARYRHALLWMPSGELLLLHAEIEGQPSDADACRQMWEQLLADAARVEIPSHPRMELEPEAAAVHFCDGVERLREWIGRGELYQANLSHQMSAPFDGNPRALYASLRSAQPTSMSAYWEDAEGHALLSHSPERFLRVRGMELTTQPIKGTAARGADEEEDRERAAALDRDSKERAELTMIVDMARNDLGRVADVGAVQVESAGEVETFPSLFHRTATVRARWKPERGLGALVSATFPPASITGAPKVAALKAIACLENRSRGPYCGSLGYWIPGRNPHGDFSVLIRTATVSGGRIRLSVGAGIVWDSDPKKEWQETLLKANYLKG